MVKYIEKIEKEETFLYIPSPLKMTDQFWFKNNLVVQTPEVKTAHYLQSYFKVLT